ncbi:MAG TPA: cobyric acid synthase [Amnibacterium sp.]|nr:cobyric acid synthase [Amnibacterium sp.]
MTAAIVALFPEVTDVNGDAQNALVLARRAQWAGEDAVVVPVALGERPAVEPTAIVLGSSVDSALPRIRDGLLAILPRLTEWLDAGVPMLAVGTGVELLGSRIDLGGGSVVEGVGLVPGSAAPLAVRVTDDLVVDAVEGRLVGYENHARGFRLDAGVHALGRVVSGVGDGHGVDGVRHGSVLGTRLHGPVLAKNPALADALLARAFGHAVVPVADQAKAADAAAAAIRARLLKGLPLR